MGHEGVAELLNLPTNLVQIFGQLIVLTMCDEYTCTCTISMLLVVDLAFGLQHATIATYLCTAIYFELLETDPVFPT